MKFLCALLMSLIMGVNAQAATLKIATISPDGTSWMKLMRAGGKEIAKKTDGRVKIKFYPGGVMGSDEAVMRKIRLGQLHGAALPTGALHSQSPNLKLYNIPALFHSFAEVDAVRQKMDETLYRELEENGFVSLGFAEGGFAYLMGKDDIGSLSQIQKRKVWIPSGDNFLTDVVENFGVAPVPLGIGDVLASLQTGMIDTVASSPTAAIALQWHTQVSNMMDFPVLYFLGTMVIKERAFNRLKDADKQVVKEVMRAKFKEIDALNRKDNLSAYDALQQMGLKLQNLDPQEAQNWRERAATMSKKLVASKQVSPALYDEVQTILTTHRLQQSGQ